MPKLENSNETFLGDFQTMCLRAFTSSLSVFYVKINFLIWHHFFRRNIEKLTFFASGAKCNLFGMTWYSRDSVQGYDKIGLAAYDSQCLEIHQKSFVISVLKVKLLLLNKTPEFSIKLNHFVIYNIFQDMFVQQHFVLKSIWIFYEAKIYYSDTDFYALFWFFGLKRHPADDCIAMF